MSVSKKLLRELADVLARTEGDGQLFLKVAYKGNAAESFSHSFSSNRYLSRLEASPDEPLKDAEEKFVNAHFNVRQKKGGTLVDPLGLFDGSRTSTEDTQINELSGKPKRKRNERNGPKDRR